jgi:hypothetical protein
MQLFCCLLQEHLANTRDETKRLSRFSRKPKSQEKFYFIKIFVFAKILIFQTFSQKSGIFAKIYNLPTLACPGRAVLSVLFQSVLESDLSCPTCFGCSFLVVCPVPDVPFQMSGQGCSAAVFLSGCPMPAVLSLLSCPCCPVPAFLFQLPRPGNLFHSSPDAPSCSGRPALCFLSWLYIPSVCSGCPVPAVLARLSCPGLSCPWCPVPAISY